MKKNLIALAVTITLTAGVMAANAATVTYTDTQGNWAQADIQALSDLKIISGYNDGLFHPDAWVTRAEFSNMTLKTLGLPPSKIDSVPSIRNVSRNTWNFSNVDNQAWISAYPSNVFRPENPVRRVEILAGLAGALNKPLVSEAEANQILSKYSDADQVPVNVRREVATAIKYELFAVDPQQSNMILPLQPATRADVAASLNNLYENRDIAIVQNGTVMAATSSGASTTTTTTTTTSSSTPADADEATTTGTTSTQITNTGTYNDPRVGTWFMSSGVPFRNSADTIEETRTITPGRLRVGQAEPATMPLPVVNSTFTGTLAKALYSEFNRPGDPVMVIIDHALFDASGRVAAPAGSKVLGYVTVIQSYNESNENAQIGMTFTQLITPSGQRVPFNATVANADGILRAEALQGVVIHPEHSLAALKREISTAEGAMYGTKIGKMEVLEQPMVTNVSDKPVDPMDIRASNIVLGVGDRLQLRITDAATPGATPYPGATTPQPGVIVLPGTTPQPDINE